MGAPDRIVRQLRLRAASEQAASRAVIRLEDALRCASLPDTGERLLLVRRLNLGRLPSDLSSQSLSLLIEQRVHEAGGSWVHGEQASADESDTVFFASRLQAAQAALRRRAAGRSLAAWYWRSALPGVQIEASDDEFLHSVIAVLAQETNAPASLPALVADIVAAGYAPWLIRHMPDETSWFVLAISGAQRHVAEAIPQLDAYSSAHTVRYVWRTTAGQSRQMLLPYSWPVWLHAVLRTAQWLPEAMLDASGREVRAEQIDSDAAAPMADADSNQQQDSEPRLHRPVAPDSAPVDPNAVPDATEALLAALPAVAGSDAPPALAETLSTQAFDPITQPPFDAAQPTQAGGLLCLLNVLARLGFADWQAQHPDAPLCGLILLQALQRLDIPEDDPAWALAASLPAPPRRQARNWQTPALWQDARISVAHDADEALTPAAMAALWLIACRRYLRRVARIGLASLVCRSAQLQWSATHLDTRFALRETDLRVRRAALDIDPGWLDWLGRVATFHYLQQFES